MSKVFISGSISINKLPSCVKDSIKKIISQELEILIGDAGGIDAIVQNFCISQRYFNVTVYSIYPDPRYICDGFKSELVLPATDSRKERERQREKDKAMTDNSSFSLVIWDGKSQGSYKNILRAIDNEKKVKVYLDYEDRFMDQEKINTNEVNFIYRENNGYTAAEVVEYLVSEGEEFFRSTRDFNKFLLEHKIIKKEDDIYKPMPDYEHLFLIDKYRGKEKGIKFTDVFIGWVERRINEIKPPEQTSFL